MSTKLWSDALWKNESFAIYLDEHQMTHFIFLMPTLEVDILLVPNLSLFHGFLCLVEASGLTLGTMLDNDNVIMLNTRI